MKKLLTIMAIVVAATTTMAAEYPYMVFRQTDGSTIVVKSEALRLSVNDGTLTVSHADGQQTLTMSNLVSMQFSKDGSGVESLVIDAAIPVEVYNTAGLCIGRYDNLDAARTAINAGGVYIIKTEKGTAKIYIQ